MAKKFYVAWNDTTGDIRLFDNWPDCDDYVRAGGGTRCRGFNNKEDAIAAFRGNEASQMLVIRAIADMVKLQGTSDPAQRISSLPGIRLPALAVDAACSRNPGPVEYRGVWLPDGRQAFHFGPLADGTNNIGEYLAIVHALALLDKHGRNDIPVYTDSMTASSWVSRGAPRTTVKPTEANAPLFDMLRRATAWLSAHPIHALVLKWPTEQWGEIPADFGRKG